MNYGVFNLKTNLARFARKVVPNETFMEFFNHCDDDSK